MQAQSSVQLEPLAGNRAATVQPVPHQWAEPHKTTATEQPAAPAKHGSGDARYLRYWTALKAACPDLPNVTISYSGLGYQAQVPVRTEEVPNIASSFWKLLTAPARLCASRATSEAAYTDFHALRGADGVLHPGDMTLILAPPGHGTHSHGTGGEGGHGRLMWGATHECR